MRIGFGSVGMLELKWVVEDEGTRVPDVTCTGPGKREKVKEILP